MAKKTEEPKVKDVKKSENTSGEKVSRNVKNVKKTEVKKVQSKPKKKPVPKGKDRKKQKRTNWNEARSLYATDSSQTYESIAKKYDVTLSTVEKRAKKESWADLRKTSGEKIIEKAAELAAQTVDEANRRHLQQWSEAAELILTRLRFVRGSAEEGVEIDPETKKLKMLFNPKEMKAIVEALKIVTEGERTARGLPNSVVRNQNENKDVDDFADLSDEEIDEILNDNTSEDSAPEEGATTQSEDRKTPPPVA